MSLKLLLVCISVARKWNLSTSMHWQSSCTVKPVLKDHSRDWKLWVSYNRWITVRTVLWGIFKGGLLTQVVFTHRQGKAHCIMPNLLFLFYYSIVIQLYCYLHNNGVSAYTPFYYYDGLDFMYVTHTIHNIWISVLCLYHNFQRPHFFLYSVSLVLTVGMTVWDCGDDSVSLVLTMGMTVWVLY